MAAKNPAGQQAAGGAQSIAHLTKIFVPKAVMGGSEKDRGEAPKDIPKGAEVYQCRFSPDGSLLAAGCGDGSIKVYNPLTSKIAYHLNTNQGETLPTTCLRFRPAGSGGSTRNVLISGSAGGTITHWHITSGKALNVITEEDNQVFAVDYAVDGTRFASGGNDAVVRIYDEQTKQCVQALSSGSGKGDSTGHSNRVFSVKWSAEQPNLLLSGGWDDVVLVWDDRQDVPVRVIFGPHIAGDSIDIHGDHVLTGAWRPDNPVQMWDLGTGNPLYDIPFPTNYGEPCLIYCVQFSKDKAAARFIAGGSGTNEARIFERESQIPSVIGAVKGMSAGVFNCDFHPAMNTVAVASGDGTIRTVEYP